MRFDMFEMMASVKLVIAFCRREPSSITCSAHVGQ